MEGMDDGRREGESVSSPVQRGWAGRRRREGDGGTMTPESGDGGRREQHVFEGDLPPALHQAGRGMASAQCRCGERSRDQSRVSEVHL